jgi:lambda repressor-like predicted transcriptional regulator
MAKKSNPSKQALVTGRARLQGLRMADLASECGVHVCTLYRVAKGEKSSRRVDTFLAKKLGITAQMLRRVGN